MKKGLICVAAIVVIVILTFLASEKLHTQKVKSTVASVSLRLKWLYDPGFGGELVAAKEGFFKHNGINVDIRPGGFEADPIKLVADGSDTFGVTGADSFLLARAKGVPIVALAAGYIETPVVYYARKNSGISSPSDWRGKKIGVQAGQDTETIYRALLSRSGLSNKDVTEVPVKYDFAQFLSGNVDVWPGYAATQSFILHKQGITYDMLNPSAFGVKYLGTVYFTTEATIQRHPEWVQGFVKGVLEGWEFVYARPDIAIADISAFDPKSLPTDLITWNLDKQKLYIKPEGRRFGEYNLVDFQNLQRTLLTQHLLNTSVDLSAAVSMRYLADVYNHPNVLAH